MQVLITGATGFIGQALREELVAAGHVAVPLHRGDPRPDARTWSVDQGRIDDDALEGIDAVVHLAGEPIGPWLTDSKKQEIMQSRRDGTRLISQAVAAARPHVFISQSGIAFYGDAGDTELTESSPKGAGFLSDVVEVWERETQPAIEAGVRTVKTRTGLVLHPDGGLLGQSIFGIDRLNLLLPFKLGLGGPMGSGRQWWSWITLRDQVRAVVHCIETESVSGVANFVGPNPVRNRDFSKALGSALNRPAVIPLPAFALKAIVGPQFAEEAVLASQRILPTVLVESGFEFLDPELGPALEAVL